MSNMRRLRRRSARYMRRNLNNTANGLINEDGTPKIIGDPLEWYFKTDKVLVMGKLEDMLPSLKESENLMHNGKYENIDIKGKIGLMYLDKIRQFAYVLMNDNYRLSILFKDESLYKLPFINRIIEVLKNQDKLPEKLLKIIENGNYPIKKVYNKHSVLDLTEVPFKRYGVNELIK